MREPTTCGKLSSGQGWVGGLAIPALFATDLLTTCSKPELPFYHRTWQAQSLALPLLRLPSMHIRATWPGCVSEPARHGSGLGLSEGHTYSSLFDTQSKEKLVELRRGTDPATLTGKHRA